MSGFDWLGLGKLEAAWAAGEGAVGREFYDSLGRPLQGLYRYAGQQASRAQRVYDALQQSGPAAQSALMHRLRGISLGAVWDLLESMVRDIAMTYCGLAVGGGALGAVLGAFAGGVGAVPGAIAGTSAGLAIATTYLEVMGLICLAKSLAGAVSEAMACYGDGVREAWGPAPNEGRSHREPGEARGDVGLAAQQIAHGHVQLLVALLNGIAMYLMRGGADRLRVLSEIRGSKQLGPRMERWVLENEEALVKEAGLRETGKAGADAVGHARDQASSSGPKGTVRKDATPGTAAHKAKRWESYQGRGGTKGYESWSKQYDTNMQNYQFGAARETEYRSAMNASEGILKTPLTNRQIDILKAEEMYAGQLKTGPVSLTKENIVAISKDAELVKQGWAVEHILEKGASQPYLNALDKAGIAVKIGPVFP